jgi:hypothetical protein
MYYRNGNTSVIIMADGTKVRYIPNNKAPEPVRPESIDLKITDKCFSRCSFCYEHSCPEGKHGNLDHPILDTLEPGTELAVGGGNPLEQINLEAFLKKMKDKEVICNITSHVRSFGFRNNLITTWGQKWLVAGIGLSVGDLPEDTDLVPVVVPKDIEKRVLYHTIIGITPTNLIKRLSKKHNVLLLGNKTQPVIKHTANELREFVAAFNGEGLYFDNLACDQLNVRSLVSENVWKERYMGDDGLFTMFIDLVTERAYKSSTVDRCRSQGVPLSGARDIRDLFQQVRNS